MRHCFDIEEPGGHLRGQPAGVVPGQLAGGVPDAQTSGFQVQDEVHHAGSLGRAGQGEVQAAAVSPRRHAREDRLHIRGDRRRERAAASLRGRSQRKTLPNARSSIR